MDLDSTVNADNKKQSQVEDTNDSDSTEIVPLTRDTDGSCTTKYVSGDLFGEVKEVHFADMKQEPYDVCFILYSTYSVAL